MLICLRKIWADEGNRLWCEFALWVMVVVMGPDEQVRDQKIVEFGNKWEEESRDPICTAGVVHFILFFQRDELCTRVPFLLPVANSVWTLPVNVTAYRGRTIVGPEFVKVTP